MATAHRGVGALGRGCRRPDEAALTKCGARGVLVQLATVPGVSPPVHYHSLLADGISVGMRYREFIVFHQEFIYPEYLVAYHRL